MSISFGQVSRFVRHAAASIDKLSTVRVASVRYSVPFRLVGRHVEVVTHDGRVRIYGPDGDVVAEHVQLAAGEASVLDEHYPTPRKPASRGPRARSDAEREFLALGQPAEAFIRQGALTTTRVLDSPEQLSYFDPQKLPSPLPRAGRGECQSGSSRLHRAQTSQTFSGRFNSATVISRFASSLNGLTLARSVIDSRKAAA